MSVQGHGTPYGNLASIYVGRYGRLYAEHRVLSVRAP